MNLLSGWNHKVTELFVSVQFVVHFKTFSFFNRPQKISFFYILIRKSLYQ